MLLLPGELVLWGTTLWDPRVPVPLHTYDQLSASAAGAFHPNGLELVLNSEVWDLRTHRLLRSIPALDGTTVQFNTGEQGSWGYMGHPGVCPPAVLPACLLHKSREWAAAAAVRAAFHMLVLVAVCRVLRVRNAGVVLAGGGVRAQPACCASITTNM